MNIVADQSERSQTTLIDCCRTLLGAGGPFRQTDYMKSRVRPPSVVANPRCSYNYSYGCDLRLA